MNRKRETRKNTLSDISTEEESSQILKKENMKHDNQNSENQINDFFRITEPLLDFTDMTKKLTFLRNENIDNNDISDDNYYNNEYNNNNNNNNNDNNNNNNNIKRNSYLLNSSEQNKIGTSDKDKWTWRPGKRKKKNLIVLLLLLLLLL